MANIKKPFYRNVLFNILIAFQLPTSADDNYDADDDFLLKRHRKTHRIAKIVNFTIFYIKIY